MKELEDLENSVTSSVTNPSETEQINKSDSYLNCLKSFRQVCLVLWLFHSRDKFSFFYRKLQAELLSVPPLQSSIISSHSELYYKALECATILKPHCHLLASGEENLNNLAISIAMEAPQSFDIIVLLARFLSFSEDIGIRIWKRLSLLLERWSFISTKVKGAQSTNVKEMSLHDIESNYSQLLSYSSKNDSPKNDEYSSPSKNGSILKQGKTKFSKTLFDKLLAAEKRNLVKKLNVVADVLNSKKMVGSDLKSCSFEIHTQNEAEFIEFLILFIDVSHKKYKEDNSCIDGPPPFVPEFADLWKGKLLVFPNFDQHSLNNTDILTPSSLKSSVTLKKSPNFVISRLSTALNSKGKESVLFKKRNTSTEYVAPKEKKVKKSGKTKRKLLPCFGKSQNSLFQERWKSMTSLSTPHSPKDKFKFFFRRCQSYRELTQNNEPQYHNSHFVLYRIELVSPEMFMTLCHEENGESIAKLVVWITQWSSIFPVVSTKPHTSRKSDLPQIKVKVSAPHLLSVLLHLKNKTLNHQNPTEIPMSDTCPSHTNGPSRDVNASNVSSPSRVKWSADVKKAEENDKQHLETEGGNTATISHLGNLNSEVLGINKAAEMDESRTHSNTKSCSIRSVPSLYSQAGSSIRSQKQVNEISAHRKDYKMEERNSESSSLGISSLSSGEDDLSVLNSPMKHYHFSQDNSSKIISLHASQGPVVDPKSSPKLFTGFSFDNSKVLKELVVKPWSSDKTEGVQMSRIQETLGITPYHLPKEYDNELIKKIPHQQVVISSDGISAFNQVDGNSETMNYPQETAPKTKITEHQILVKEKETQANIVNELLEGKSQNFVETQAKVANHLPTDNRNQTILETVQDVLRNEVRRMAEQLGLGMVAGTLGGLSALVVQSWTSSGQIPHSLTSVQTQSCQPTSLAAHIPTRETNGLVNSTSHQAVPEDSQKESKLLKQDETLGKTEISDRQQVKHWTSRREQNNRDAKSKSKPALKNNNDRFREKKLEELPSEEESSSEDTDEFSGEKDIMYKEKLSGNYSSFKRNHQNKTKSTTNNIKPFKLLQVENITSQRKLSNKYAKKKYPLSLRKPNIEIVSQPSFPLLRIPVEKEPKLIHPLWISQTKDLVSQLKFKDSSSSLQKLSSRHENISKLVNKNSFSNQHHYLFFSNVKSKMKKSQLIGIPLLRCEPVVQNVPFQTLKQDLGSKVPPEIVKEFLMKKDNIKPQNKNLIEKMVMTETWHDLDNQQVRWQNNEEKRQKRREHKCQVERDLNALKQTASGNSFWNNNKEDNASVKDGALVCVSQKSSQDKNSRKIEKLEPTNCAPETSIFHSNPLLQNRNFADIQYHAVSVLKKTDVASLASQTSPVEVGTLTKTHTATQTDSHEEEGGHEISENINVQDKKSNSGSATENKHVLLDKEVQVHKKTVQAANQNKTEHAEDPCDYERKTEVADVKSSLHISSGLADKKDRKRFQPRKDFVSDSEIQTSTVADEEKDEKTLQTDGYGVSKEKPSVQKSVVVTEKEKDRQSLQLIKGSGSTIELWTSSVITEEKDENIFQTDNDAVVFNEKPAVKQLSVFNEKNDNFNSQKIEDSQNSRALVGVEDMTDLVFDEGVSHPQDTDHDSHVETEENEKNIQLSTARKNSDVENKYLKKPHGKGNIKEIIKQTVNIEALNEPPVSFSGSSIDKQEVKMQQKNEASCLPEQFKMMQQQLEAIEEMSENVKKGFQNTKQFLKTVEHLSGAYYVDEEIANGFHLVDDAPTGTYSHSEVIAETPRSYELHNLKHENDQKSVDESKSGIQRTSRHHLSSQLLPNNEASSSISVSEKADHMSLGSFSLTESEPCQDLKGLITKTRLQTTEDSETLSSKAKYHPISKNVKIQQEKTAARSERFLQHHELRKEQVAELLKDLTRPSSLPGRTPQKSVQEPVTSVNNNTCSPQKTVGLSSDLFFSYSGALSDIQEDDENLSQISEGYEENINGRTFSVPDASPLDLGATFTVPDVPLRSTVTLKPTEKKISFGSTTTIVFPDYENGSKSTYEQQYDIHRSGSYSKLFPLQTPYIQALDEMRVKGIDPKRIRSLQKLYGTKRVPLKVLETELSQQKLRDAKTSEPYDVKHFSQRIKQQIHTLGSNFKHPPKSPEQPNVHDRKMTTTPRQKPSIYRYEPYQSPYEGVKVTSVDESDSGETLSSWSVPDDIRNIIYGNLGPQQEGTDIDNTSIGSFSDQSTSSHGHR